MHTSKLSYTLLTCLLTCCRKQKFFSPLNLNRLQFFIDSGRLNPKEPITMYHLWRSGAVGGRIKDGVKLLGTVSPPYFSCTATWWAHNLEDCRSAEWEIMILNLPTWCYQVIGSWPSLILMSKNNRFCSLALGLAHVKVQGFDVSLKVYYFL